MLGRILHNLVTVTSIILDLKLCKSHKRKPLSLAAQRDAKQRKLRRCDVGDSHDHSIIDLTKNCGDKRNSEQSKYWIKDLGLYMSDRESLNDGEWLTDAVINAAQLVLKNQFAVGGLQDTNHGHTLTYDIVRQEFIQILNVRGSHWVTISNIGCLQDNINVYDSLPYGDLSTRSKKEIAAMLFTTSKQITLNFMDVQSQRGGSDCGLFSIAFATSLCFGSDPVHVNYLQGGLRSHLLSCLSKVAFSDFPHTQKRRYSVRKRSVQKFDVYCVCRQPECGQMIRCDMCYEWYHKECVPVPRAYWRNKKLKWSCKQCN